MYQSLRATSRALANYLESYLAAGADALAAEFSSGNFVVSLNTPEEMDNVEGLSVWLYRVVRDEHLLNAPPHRINDREEVQPLPLRLHYLMTPIVEPDSVNGTENEQLILGKVLQALHDHSSLRGVDYNLTDLDGTDTEATVRLEPLALEEITRVWDALDASYQLSVSYEVSVVEIASAKETIPFEPVMSVLSEAGVVVEPETP